MRALTGRPPNGVLAHQLTDAAWHKSTHSGAIGNCVEVAPLMGGDVAMRNSRHPFGPALIYPRAEMATFVASVKDGEFDGTLG